MRTLVVFLGSMLGPNAPIFKQRFANMARGIINHLKRMYLGHTSGWLVLFSKSFKVVAANEVPLSWLEPTKYQSFGALVGGTGLGLQPRNSSCIKVNPNPRTADSASWDPIASSNLRPITNPRPEALHPSRCIPKSS